MYIYIVCWKYILLSVSPFVALQHGCVAKRTLNFLLVGNDECGTTNVISCTNLHHKHTYKIGKEDFYVLAITEWRQFEEFGGAPTKFNGPITGMFNGGSCAYIWIINYVIIPGSLSIQIT